MGERRWPALALTLVLVAPLVGYCSPIGEPGSTARGETSEPRVDRIQPSAIDGMHWTASWSEPRVFMGIDPLDPWFDADHGAASYRVEDQVLSISGATPRMYVYDPDMERQWGDVEITVYAKRISDEGVPYSGIVAVARSNHLVAESGGSEHPCDTRGYGGRFRFDGRTDFEKETSHPRNQAVSQKRLWPQGMPKGRWIGYKFLVYDKDDGVHLELWRDMTNGRDGGDWHLVNSFVDDGETFGSEPCAPGIDPMMALTNSPDREGSETGLPNLSVYFRSDGIDQDGLLYKWASVREITPRSP